MTVAGGRDDIDAVAAERGDHRLDAEAEQPIDAAEALVFVGNDDGAQGHELVRQGGGGGGLRIGNDGRRAPG